MAELSPHVADPFEVFYSAQRDRRIHQVVIALLLAWNVVLVGLLVVVLARRPDVIIKDRVFGEQPLVTRGQGDPPITATDARIFFINMLKLRYGWDSYTVGRDMDAFISQCYKPQRLLEKAYMTEMVAVGDDKPTQKPRLQMWVEQNVKRILSLPEALEDVDCRPSKEQIWHCFVKGTLTQQRLSPPFLTNPPQTQLSFVASLLPVPHTTDNPYGLVVGAMRDLPGDSQRSPK